MRAVVFDMDGVLLDSESVYELAWRNAAGMLGLDGIDEVHSKVLGMDEKGCIETLKGRYGKNFDAKGFWDLTTDLSVKYMEENGIPLKAHAGEILQYLKAKKYPLALATSNDRDFAQDVLRDSDLLDFFDFAVYGNEISKSKPDPEIYVKACEKLGVAPEDTVAVEDSPNGIKSAWEAGLKTVMVPDRIQPDDEILKSVWNLLPDLKSLEKIL